MLTNITLIDITYKELLDLLLELRDKVLLSLKLRVEPTDFIVFSKREQSTNNYLINHEHYNSELK